MPCSRCSYFFLLFFSRGTDGAFSGLRPFEFEFELASLLFLVPLCFTQAFLFCPFSCWCFQRFSFHFSPLFSYLLSVLLFLFHIYFIIVFLVLFLLYSYSLRFMSPFPPLLRRDLFICIFALPSSVFRGYDDVWEREKEGMEKKRRIEEKKWMRGETKTKEFGVAYCITEKRNCPIACCHRLLCVCVIVY